MESEMPLTFIGKVGIISIRSHDLHDDQRCSEWPECFFLAVAEWSWDHGQTIKIQLDLYNKNFWFHKWRSQGEL